MKLPRTLIFLFLFLIFCGSFALSARADITTGLVGYWTFDEGSGTNANDTSGNNHNGTLVNSPSWVAGKIGAHALSFSGGSDKVTTSFTMGTYPISECAWVYPTATGNLNYFIDSAEAELFWVGFGSNYFSVYNNNVGLNAADGTTALNTWQHVCATIDASNNAIIYKNGASIASGNLGALVIGTAFVFGNATNGYVDDVRIYSRVLSPSDISEAYAYTGGGGGGDATPPVISSIASSTAATTATITWTTDEAATSTVSYGLTTSYGSVSSSDSFVTSHSMDLSSLTADTVYHYKVSSSDSSGNVSSSGDKTFRTAAAPVVPSFPIIVSLSGRGSGIVSGGLIACGVTCLTPIVSGDSITLTAVPLLGSTFTGWTGGGCSGTGSCTVTLSATTSVTADFLSPSLSSLIPANRMSDWTPGTYVGVPGGIPTNRNHLIDVTAAPYNADKTGASDASAAIQSAIVAAAANDVVYMPAGTYRLDNPLYIGKLSSYSDKDSITLRGAGMGATTLDCRAARCIDVGSESDYLWNYPSSGNTITAGLSKGSTQVTLADTSAFSAGAIVKISVANDPTLPSMHVSGYANVRTQMSRVTGKTATTLTLFPPLYADYTGLVSHVYVAQYQSDSIGLEDMTVDMSNGTGSFGIILEQTYGSWIKNVKVRHSSNYSIYLVDSVNDEIRKSYMDELIHSGTNGSGLLVQGASASLAEDNIILKSFPHIEINSGSTGNVFSYNFLEGNDVFGIMGSSIDSNHAPHNSYNLFEGNIASVFQSDGYFGSDSEETLFRNWFHATSETTDQYGRAVGLNRFARNFSIVGNILGRTGYAYSYDNANAASSYSTRYIYNFGLPNIGNGTFNGGFASLSQGITWPDLSILGTLTTRTDNTTGVVTLTAPSSIATDQWPITVMWAGGSRINLTAGTVSGATVPIATGPNAGGDNLPLSGTAVQLWPGSNNGFQELDLDVRATSILEDNYNYATHGIPSSESIGGTALPNSLYLSAKPSWFGVLTWPPFNPSSPNPSYDSIPAGYRYQHGADPAAEADAVTDTGGGGGGSNSSGSSHGGGGGGGGAPSIVSPAVLSTAQVSELGQFVELLIALGVISSDKVDKARAFVLSQTKVSALPAQTGATSSPCTYLCGIYSGSVSDIKTLQTILARDPSVYPEAYVTGTLGPLTTKAIQKFQIKYGIATQGDAGFGFVGPKTQGKLLEMSKALPVHIAPTQAPLSSPAPQPPVPVPQAPVVSTAVPVTAFTRSLSLGSEGEDVRFLQKILNALGFAVAESGPGSKGHETTTFDESTKLALARFQTDRGIFPASGSMGEITRIKLLEAWKGI